MRFSLTPLSLTLTAILFGNVAFANDTDQEPVADLGVLQVTVSADASKSGLLGEYAGGQVAKGARVGILGTKHTMDTPFSTTAYTQKFIKNTGSDSVGDVLKKDPTVTVARGYGNFQESYIMRGFTTYSDDTMYNGLYGILPRQYTASELFERVEVQRGASTALNGISPGGANTGGTITLLPKRATNSPKREVSISYETEGLAKVAADVGQRFGANNEFGVRVNASYLKGDAAIARENKEVKLIAVGADYRGENARLSADVGHQDLTDTAKRSSVDVNQAGGIPEPVDGKTNWTQDWANAKAKDTFATVRGEYDFGDNLTGFVAYGMRQGQENNVLGGGFFYLTNAKTGDGYYTLTNNHRKDDTKTGEVGLKGKVALGKTTHNWSAVYNHFDTTEKNHFIADYPAGYNNFAGANYSNLYNPALHAAPPDWSASKYATPTGSLDNPAITAKTKLQSVAVANTVGLMDDKLQITLGARHQEIDSQDVTWNTFYKDKKTSPVAAINYRFGNWSAFANYSEKLTAGKQVQVNQDNLLLAPYVSKQGELGLKYDNGQLGGSATVFQIKEPRASSIAWGAGSRTGDNVHQGLEVMTYGKLSPNLRLQSGFTYLDAKQTGTNDALEGKQVIGVAKFRSSLGLEYDLASVNGLTLTGDVAYTGSRYANESNTLKVDGFGLLNLGARYETDIAGRGVTLRGVLENAANQKHWASVGGYPEHGYLVAGEPRTLKVSATMNF